MRDYLKAVWANQATLAGYAFTLGGTCSFAAGRLLDQNGWSSALLAGAGILLLYLTDLGRDTLRNYRRAREHIAEHGSLGPRVQGKFSRYCDYVGMRLAAREAGLEHLLNADCSPEDFRKGSPNFLPYRK